MKYITIILFSAGIFFQANKIYVLYLKGKAHSASTGKPINVGNAVQPSDILFDDPKSKIVCISPEKGRFEIVPGKKKPGTSELWAVLKDVNPFAVKHYHFSTRGVGFEGYDPATYFQSAETDNRILLISDAGLPISSTYKLDSANFFFLQYTVQGKRVVKKIDQAGTGISFNLQTFSAASPNDLPATVSLCYQSVESGAGRSRVIAEFTPALLSKTDLDQQAQLIKKYMGGTNQRKFTTELETFLYDNYGKIGQEELTALSK